MEFDWTKLFVEFLFGLVGMAYFIYGKKTGKLIFLLCGITLSIFPYFLDSLWAVAVVGVGMTGIPFLIRSD